MARITYTPSEIAKRLEIGETRVRSVIRQEVAAMVPDELRMIPGGRFDERVMLIYAGIFDAVVSGHAITRTPPGSSESFIRRRQGA